MEPRRFDTMLRLLTALRDRRETVSGVLALVLATLLATDATAAKNGGKGGGGKGGKGGGKNKKNKGKNKDKKNRKKKRKKAGGFTPRNCDDLAVEPGADLHECDLRAHPGLASADFTNAKLEDTLLSGADLSGVAFRGARLWRAKLDGATLTDADFRDSGDKRTDLFATDFTDADLTGAQGVEIALYVEPYAVFCRTTMPDGVTVDDSDCPANG